jgi:hypothetical protein
VALASGGAGPPADVARAGNAGTIHYPDLRTRPPFALSVSNVAGVKELRFSNLIWNGGDGPIELRPQNDAQAGVTYAYQRLYSHDGPGSFYVVAEALAGTFAYHPTHFHWHFGEFSRYELRDLAPDGRVGENVLSIDDKVSFCLLDVAQINANLEHSAPFTYTSCGRTVNQGISVGWGDIYSSDLPGQELDITGLPDGTYWLKSTADPANRLLETHDGNNAAYLKIAIAGTSVQVLSTDTDVDGIPNEIDGCPTIDNGGQENFVHPATPAGDHCEDPDGDAVVDLNDNCPDVANPGQADGDGDGFGNECDDDIDADGIPNGSDGDMDGDGLWNVDEVVMGSNHIDLTSTPERCDGIDNDGDGATDEVPAGANWDIDGDAIKDCLDLDVDTDGDGQMNVADPDDDNDGFKDSVESNLTTDGIGACPASGSHDAWAPDRDHDGDSDIGDVIRSFRDKLLIPAAYDARSDPDGDRDNDIGDLIQLFKTTILTAC